MVNTVSKEDVKEAIDSGEAEVINVLSKQSHDNMHIQGSRSIPLEQLKEGKWESLNKNSRYIVYCFNEACQASPKAAKFLEDKGFNVSDYEGGIVEWAKEGLPVEGKVSREEFLESAGEESVPDREEVQQTRGVAS